VKEQNMLSYILVVFMTETATGMMLAVVVSVTEALNDNKMNLQN
jgi:hypothetical protein